MTTPLEDLLLNEITPQYVAKNIAPYLQVTVPEPPQILVDILSQQPEAMTAEQALEMYNVTLQTDGREEAAAFLRAFNKGEFNPPVIDEEAQTKEYQLQQQQEDEYMGALDLYTQPEKDAYTVACYAGLAMRRFIRVDPSEVIVRKKNGIPLEIRITPELFENYISLSIDDGMKCLEGDYWMPIKDITTPEIINSDFKPKALEWLKQELYSRIADGSDCLLLEKVIVRKDEDGMILLRDKKKSQNS
ncbi:MAG: hypothetical protein Q8R37_03475 [Nanoarchaeota archaeon]|nr:hypothetical protein [Nanoarchaeota archaeon]